MEARCFFVLTRYLTMPFNSRTSFSCGQHYFQYDIRTAYASWSIISINSKWCIMILGNRSRPPLILAAVGECRVCLAEVKDNTWHVISIMFSYLQVTTILRGFTFVICIFLFFFGFEWCLFIYAIYVLHFAGQCVCVCVFMQCAGRWLQKWCWALSCSACFLW